MDEAPRTSPLARAGSRIAWAALVVLVVSVGLGVAGATLGPPLPAPTVPMPSVGPASIAPSPPTHRVESTR